jgi:TolA-binding protein
MKKTILFFLLLNTSISIAQSKKEQIEMFKLRIDSLNSVIYVERNSSSNSIINLNSKISVLEIKIDSLSLMLKNNKDSLYKKELEFNNLNIKYGKINNDLALLETRLDSLKKVQLMILVLKKTSMQVSQN